MKENILQKLSITIDVDEDESSIKEHLSELLCDINEVYSYLVYAEYNCGKLKNFVVEMLVSHTAYFNTLKHNDVIQSICAIILNTVREGVQRYVVGYKQPPLDKLITAYEPLVHSLARQQQMHWRQIEYDDLCQMCRMVICTLYNAGYYIHKNLIRRAFTNEVLMYMRKYKHQPHLVSLDDKVCNDSDNMCLKDVIPDKLQDENRQDEEDEEVSQQALIEQRDLVISIIGERQYDRLLAEYGTKTTTAWGQKTTHRIRQKLKEQGITDYTFWRNL